MRFLDDKDKDKEKENINGAECERKQGNDEGRHCKKGTGLPSHYGDTATDRKPIPRTLEGAIYVVQSHWSVTFGMAMCNYEIKIL